MDEIARSVDLSIALMRWSGVTLAIITASYFFLYKKRSREQVLSLKKVITLALISGIINAGVNITFGKVVFFITPIALGIVVLLWLLKKFPLTWGGKHILTFCSVFFISSFVTFFGVGTLFFHLAVEGKV